MNIEYKTWDQWNSLGYYVIRGMKASWLYSKEYGKEVAMFSSSQVLKNLPKSNTHFIQDNDDLDLDYEIGGRYYDDRPY